MRMSIAAVALFAAATPALALPAAGTMFPADFAATDSAGTSRTLQSVAGRNGTVLVITRSARWCPYCQAQMKELEAARAPLAAKGYGLAAMTYDPPAVLAAFGAKNGLGYTLLADEGSANIDRLGLRDPAYPAGHFAHGVARASVLVVDAAGKISAVRIEDDYKVRPTVAQVVAMAK